jgi:hypothetical protein
LNKIFVLLYFVFQSILMLILIFNEFLLLFLFFSENAPESEGGSTGKRTFF